MQNSISKASLWAGRVVSGLTALFLLLDGVMKLFKPAFVVEATVKLGYPESVIIPLGTVLVLSTILYLIPATSILGAILLTGYLGGAVATHVRVNEGWFADYLCSCLWDPGLARTLLTRPSFAIPGPAKFLKFYLKENSIMNIALWIIQILLALLFLFAGVTKLVLPIEVLTAECATKFGALPRPIHSIHRRGRNAWRGWVDLTWSISSPAGVNTAGCCRTRDYHDWRGGNNCDGTGHCDGDLAAGNWTSLRVRRVRQVENRTAQRSLT